MTHSKIFSTFAAVLALVVCSALLASGDTPTPPSDLGGFLLSDLVIEPSAEHENSFDCSMTIANPQTGETLSSPRVVFRSGEDARTRSGIVVDGKSAEITVLVRADAQDRTAQVLVELVQETGNRTLQKLRVHL